MIDNENPAQGMAPQAGLVDLNNAGQHQFNQFNTSPASRDQSSHDHIAAFSEFAWTLGVAVKTQHLVPAKLQRWPTVCHPRRRDGATVLYLDGRPSGYVENFITGDKVNWSADAKALPLSVATRLEIDRSKRQREIEQRQNYESAARRALAIWLRNDQSGNNHPYLVARGVPPFGLRQMRGSLIVPCRDNDGRIQTLQFIGADSGKKFLTGGMVAGGYHSIGPCPALSNAVALAEGYATGASVHMATDLPVAVALSAGNLLPVARAIRARFPRVRIILAANNDASGRGLKEASTAAQAVGGVVVIPPTTDDDFNCIATRDGLQAVRTLIMGVTQ